LAIKLTIPSIAEKADPSVEHRRVYVEEWIEALPYANPSVLGNTLLEAVSKLTRNPAKAATRLALMELHARPYQYLLDMQRKHSSSRTAAAFEKHRADSDVTRRVTTEIAYGYKIVIAHSVGKKSLFGKKQGRRQSSATRDVVLVIQLVAFLTNICRHRRTFGMRCGNSTSTRGTINSAPTPPPLANSDRSLETASADCTSRVH
tara:strand:+ start:101 stop:712 length:612 start_codon:yes stop_codon:yes gene_type:complete